MSQNPTYPEHKGNQDHTEATSVISPSELFFEPDHVAINVQSLERSRKFYSKLGGVVTSSPSDKFMAVALGTLSLHILPKGTNGNDQSPKIDHIAIKVRNLKSLEDLCAILNQCEELRDVGPFKIEESPTLGPGQHLEFCPPLQSLYFKDPDGISFEVRCYNP
jgi:catechol 2,3-dioxygenase-like lactoylglutathione lyase family enzyme